MQCLVFLVYSRYYSLFLTVSSSFSLNFRFFLPSSFTIILSFFFIDPCVGFGTVSFFLSYSSLHVLTRHLETDLLFPFSFLNSFFISLLMSASYSLLWFICYSLGSWFLLSLFLILLLTFCFYALPFCSLLLSLLLVPLFFFPGLYACLGPAVFYTFTPIWVVPLSTIQLLPFSLSLFQALRPGAIFPLVLSGLF